MQAGPTQTTDGSAKDDRWASRPLLARTVKIVIAVTPFVVSIGVGLVVSRVLPPATLGVNRWLWLMGLAALTMVTLSRIDKVVSRLAPLSALLQLSLVFPDETPARYKSAMRSFSTRKVQARIDRMRDAGFTLNAEESRSQTMLDLVAALSEHDRRTRGHSERVRAYAEVIGRELGLEESELDRLQWASLLHDLGKLTVPAEILNKKGKPDEQEWATLKAHPAAGYPMAAPIIDWLGVWSSAIGQHHERWDGDGYPDGVAGEDIPLPARIVAVADAYDVMTASRSYKKPFPAEVARQEIAAGSGGQFCPTVARAFLAIPSSRLKSIAGPASWLGGLPGLAKIPVVEIAGASAATATAAGVTAITALLAIPSLAPLPAAVEEDVQAPPAAVASTTEQPRAPLGLPRVDSSTPTLREVVVEVPTESAVGVGAPPTSTSTPRPVSAGTTTTTAPAITTSTTTTATTATTTTAPATTTSTTTTTTTTAPGTTTTTSTSTTTTTVAPVAPVVAPGQVFAVSEAAAVSTPVGGVDASDADSAVSGFTILTGNGDGIFAIDSSGVLTVADITNLDFESRVQYTLGVTATDGTLTSAAVDVTVNIVNAIEAAADVGGPYLISEGDAVVLDGSGSTGSPVSWNWDIDNDGQYDDATGQNPTVSWATLVALGLGDDGVHPISLQVNANDDTELGSITIDNTPAVLTVSGPSTVTVGQSYTLSLAASDPGDDTVSGWVINWGDGTIETVAGTPPSVAHTYTRPGFTFNVLASATDEDGTVLQNELLVPSFDANAMFRFGATSGAFLQKFGAPDAPIESIIGPDGMLYVSGEISDDIRRYDATTGAFVDVFIAAGSGGLDGAEGITFGPDGNLYVANWTGNNVLRFNGTTGAFLDVFASGAISRPYGVNFGPDSNLYVSSYTGNNVFRYAGLTGAFIDIFVGAGSGGLNTPEQMSFGPDGNLYVASFNSDQVLRYDGATGLFLDVFVPTGGASALERPTAVKFGPDGNLYVADHNNNRILRFNGSTGAFIDNYVSPGAGGLTRPDPMTFLPKHQIRVTL